MIKNKETIDDGYAVVAVGDDNDEGYYCVHFNEFKDAKEYFNKNKIYWIKDYCFSNIGKKPRLLLIKHKRINIEKIKVLKSLDLRKSKTKKD